MIDKETTKNIVRQFFQDSYNFWRREGKGDNEAYAIALEEAATIKRDPFTPVGELLDEAAQKECIAEELRKELK